MICQRLYCSIPSKYFVEFPVMVDLADQFCIILGTIPYLPYIHTASLCTAAIDPLSLSLLLCVARALLSRLIHFNSSFLSFSFYHTRLEREEKNPIPLLSLLFILLLFFPFFFLISLLSSSPPLPANSLSERSETGLQAIWRFWSIGYNRPLLLPAAPVLLSNRVQLEPALTSLFIRRLLAQTANSFPPEILPPVSLALRFVTLDGWDSPDPASAG